MIDSVLDRSAESHSHQRLLMWSVLAVLAVILPLASTFGSMVSIWNRDSTFTHGYIIPLLTIWLLWSDRARLQRIAIRPARSALFAIAALVIVWMIADLSDVQVVEQAVAVTLIPCALWFVLGTQFVRAAFFPLAYLLFGVPFGDFLVPYLVEFTTDFTVAAVRLVGVPIFREGTSFSLPSGNFEVIKACSGVRYLIAMVALGTLFAALNYVSWRRRLAFMALCLVFPVFANGLRAFGIVMIAHYSELKYAVGVDHLIYGWLFFGVVMWALIWIGLKFSDRGTEQITNASVPASEVANVIDAASEPRYMPAVCAVLVAALAFGPVVNYAWRSTATDASSNDLPHLQVQRGMWSGPTPVGDAWRPAFAAQELSASGRYVSSEGAIHVFARRYVQATHGRETNRDNEATAALLIADGRSDLRFDVQDRHTTPDGHSVTAAVVAAQRGERWRLWSWYYVDDSLAQSPRTAKLLQLRSWLRHRVPVTTVVSVATQLHDINAVAIPAADRLLADFSSVTEWRIVDMRSNHSELGVL